MADKMPPKLPEDFMNRVKQREKSLSVYEAVLSERELLALNLPKVDWIFDRLIPAPALIALTGRPGSYKTFFAHWIARRASLGLPIFDHHDETPEWDPVKNHEPIETLFVQEEMGPEIIQERLGDLKQGNPDKVHWIIGADFSLKDEGDMNDLIRLVNEKHIKMLILDPFSSVARMKDENDNAEAAKIMDTILNKLVNNGPKITVIFLHHPSKSQNGADAIRGAGDILGKSYIQYVLEKVDGYDSTRIRVKCPKHRWRQIHEFEMEIVESSQKEDLRALTFVYRGGSEAGSDKENELRKYQVSLVKKWLTENVSRLEISIRLGMDNTGRKFRSLLEDAKSGDKSDS